MTQDGRNFSDLSESDVDGLPDADFDRYQEWKINGKIATINQIQAENKQLDATINQIQAENKQLDATINQIQAENKQLEATINQIQAENKQLEARINQNNKKINQNNKKIALTARNAFPAYELLLKQTGTLNTLSADAKQLIRYVAQYKTPPELAETAERFLRYIDDSSPRK